MCSWCYGFAPEISKVKEHLSDWEFKLVMGGLRPYNTEHINGMKDFLKEHWEQVHARSNQPFNYDILDDPDFIYDTEPPARAVVTMRSIDPKSEFGFFKAVQRVFYHKNSDTSLASTYTEILEQMGLGAYIDEFTSTFESDQLKALVKEDFQYAGALGVQGFPALVAQVNDKYYLMSKGYEPAAGIIERLDQVTAQV